MREQYPYLIVLGLGIAVYHVILAVRELLLRRDGVRARGEVVTWRERPTGDAQVDFYPVVRFTGADGITHAAETRHSTPARYARVGRQVGVVYAPADPTQVSITDVGSMSRLGSLVWIAIGLGLAVFALSVLRPQ